LNQIEQYEILHRLGAGAHGTVFYATDTLLMRPVVVKILDRRDDAEEERRSRMLEEARIASALEHPNVCAIFEVGEHQGRPYIVMQYAPGRTLAELIGEGPLNLRFALSIGIQVADGLAAAHRLGILHRDLKPANIMVADDGLAKILDFGLARRRTMEPDPGGGVTAPDAQQSSQQFGTLAYMAPEQFLLRRSSEQSDIFSLGVILYEMVTGRHPLVLRNTDPLLVPGAIQSRQPTPPSAVRPELPASVDEILLKTLAKQTANRFRHASEVRDALRALMRQFYHETGFVPGETSAVLPTPPPPARERTGLFTGLVERFLPARSHTPAEDAVAVLPFQDLDSPENSRIHGFLLSNAVATRLAQVPGLVVRPLSAYSSISDRVVDPVEAARQLRAQRVLLGSFVREGDGLVVHWQLLEAETQAIRCGGTVTVPTREVALLQNEIASRILADLRAAGELPETAAAEPVGTRLEELPPELREEYLEARALLVSFASRAGQRGFLDRARELFERVLERAPEFASAHAGLGTVFLRYARNGFGGVDHLMAAQRCLSRALELEPGLVDAKLYRASTLLWAGEKETARLDIQFLLGVAPPSGDVCVAAGVALKLDGMLEEALRLHGLALRIEPALATRVYYYRARCLIMLERHEAALAEIRRGLALAPDHSLLRNTLGYWHFYHGDLQAAIAELEPVLEAEPTLRIAYPTLAMCYARAGRTAEAAALVGDETTAAAAADAEIAYRLATYWAVAGNEAEALAWLRRSIYRGNENYPWFSRNPAWEPLHGNEEFRKILSDLEQVHRLSRPRWERTLASLPA
jgi:eukaryotic-like serine/threonine-protein kinase